MNLCEHIRRQALALVASARSERELKEAWEHARTCAGCAQALQEGERMLALIDAELAPSPPSAEALLRVKRAVQLELDRQPARPLRAARVAVGVRRLRGLARGRGSGLGVARALCGRRRPLPRARALHRGMAARCARRGGWAFLVDLGLDHSCARLGWGTRGPGGAASHLPGAVCDTSPARVPSGRSVAGRRRGMGRAARTALRHLTWSRNADPLPA